jgi:hypothetical protein
MLPILRFVVLYSGVREIEKARTVSPREETEAILRWLEKMGYLDFCLET